MNKENKPNGMSEGRVSKLKRRRRAPNNHIMNIEAGSRQKLGTITMDVGSTDGSANHPVLPQIDTHYEVPDEDCDLDIAQMSQSEMQSALSLIGGVQMYTKSEYEHAISQSFAYGATHRNTKDDGKRFRKISDYPLLGQVDLTANPTTVRASEKDSKLSLAFPLSRFTEKDQRKDEYSSVLCDAFKIPIENGMRIPLSFCQFPSSKPQSETKIQSKNINENVVISGPSKGTMDQVAMTNQYEQKPRNELTENNEYNSNDRERLKNINEQAKYSKIRIEATIGASIREAFDIDLSEQVIGKLKYGDERYYLEKKMLPPPPISEEDCDDECVAVMRYKILLEEGDDTRGVAERDDRNRVVGWISDRGRLADEPYKIVREVY